MCLFKVMLIRVSYRDLVTIIQYDTTHSGVCNRISHLSFVYLLVFAVYVLIQRTAVRKYAVEIQAGLGTVTNKSSANSVAIYLGLPGSWIYSYITYNCIATIAQPTHAQVTCNFDKSWWLAVLWHTQLPHILWNKWTQSYLQIYIKIIH